MNRSHLLECGARSPCVERLELGFGAKPRCEILYTSTDPRSLDRRRPRGSRIVNRGVGVQDVRGRDNAKLSFCRGLSTALERAQLGGELRDERLALRETLEDSSELAVCFPFDLAGEALLLLVLLNERAAERV